MKIKKTLLKELAKPIKAKQVWVMDESGPRRGFHGWYKVEDVRIVPAIFGKDEYLLFKIDIPK